MKRGLPWGTEFEPGDDSSLPIPTLVGMGEFPPYPVQKRLIPVICRCTSIAAKRYLPAYCATAGSTAANTRQAARADQPMEAQIKQPSLRGPQGRGNPAGRLDCHGASFLAMTMGTSA
jgi:hypothetical protein